LRAADSLAKKLATPANWQGTMGLQPNVPLNSDRGLEQKLTEAADNLDTMGAVSYRNFWIPDRL
jgi:hypothetical protein